MKNMILLCLTMAAVLFLRENQDSDALMLHQEFEEVANEGHYLQNSNYEELVRELRSGGGGRGGGGRSGGGGFNVCEQQTQAQVAPVRQVRNQTQQQQFC